MASKVFLDANIILDFVLKRANHNEAKIVFELEQKHKIRLFISSSILHIIGYYLSKNLGIHVAKQTLIKLLDIVEVIDANHEIALRALESDFLDIEDSLQYFIAIKSKMDYLITFDKDFQKYNSDKLPIIEPFLLVQKL